MSSADQHVFQEAPCIGWLAALWRFVDFTTKPPSLLQAAPGFPKQPISPTGQAATLAKPEHAQEYSTFLANWYYKATDPVILAPPPEVFEKNLGKNLIGIEVRTPQKFLAGIIFLWRAGRVCGQPAGIVTWHCVHPTWRKRGIPNVMLKALWRAVQPCISFWFRNPHGLHFALPPITMEYRIVRKQRGQTQYSVKRVSLQPLLPQLKTEWLKRNPTGIVFDPDGELPLLEAWQLQIRNQPIVTLFVQPTFEWKRQTGESWCEVITWLTHSTLNSFSEQMYIETICDSLPYTWIDAPTSLPHVESLWLKSNLSTWSAAGIDPGNPFQRPVLPLQAY